MGERLTCTARIHPGRPGRNLVRRATLGFLSDSFTDHYQLSLLRGAAEAARDSRVNLIAFAGGVPSRREPEHALASPRSVDALIVTASTMAYGIGLDGLAEYCRALGNMPLCFLGAQVSGVPAILTDNADGMVKAVRHLIQVHGKHTVAFIGGPPGNPEADARLGAYRKVLQEADLAFDEQLVAHGDFMRHAGRRAMAEILDRGKQPDAVAGANDMMVFGACETLAERGLSVPDDVAVVGFDDMEEGRFSSPALTSVRQPLEQQGREAVRIALAAIDGNEVPESTTLSLDLVLRGSCGCGNGASGLAVGAGEISRSFELAFNQRMPVLLAEMSRAAQASLGRVNTRWRENVTQGLLDDLRAHSHEHLAAALGAEVALSRQSDGRLGMWHRVLSALRTEAVRCLQGDPERAALAEDLLHDAREQLATEMQNEQAMRRMKLEHQVRSLRESGLALGGVRDLDGLLEALVEHLRRLNFKRGYLALHDDDAKTSRLVLGYDRDLPLEQRSEPVTFPTLELTPPNLRPTEEEQTCVALPVGLGEERYGYLLLDQGPGDGLVWETLREQVALALRFCTLATARSEPG